MINRIFFINFIVSEFFTNNKSNEIRIFHRNKNKIFIVLYIKIVIVFVFPKHKVDQAQISVGYNRACVVQNADTKEHLYILNISSQNCLPSSSKLGHKRVDIGIFRTEPWSF